MPNNNDERQSNPIPPAKSIFIPTPAEIAERERRERENQQQADHQLLMDLQTRQTGAEERQADSNSSIVKLTRALVLVSIVSAVVAYLQFSAGKDSANAAKSAAETAKKTLELMDASGIETKTQIDRLIEQQQRTANSSEGVLKQNRDSLAATLTQAQKSLDISIDAMRLEQRPYIQGEVSIKLLEVLPSGHHQFIASYALRVSGKSPATNVIGYKAFRMPSPTYIPLLGPPGGARIDFVRFTESVRPWAERAFKDAETDPFPVSFQTVAPGRDGGSMRSNVLSVAPDTLSKIRTGEHVLLFAGKVTYRDRLQKPTDPPHETQFCAFHYGFEGTGTTIDAGTPKDAGTLSCGVHNDVR